MGNKHHKERRHDETDEQLKFEGEDSDAEEVPQTISNDGLQFYSFCAPDAQPTKSVREKSRPKGLEEIPEDNEGLEGLKFHSFYGPPTQTRYEPERGPPTQTRCQPERGRHTGIEESHEDKESLKFHSFMPEVLLNQRNENDGLVIAEDNYGDNDAPPPPFHTCRDYSIDEESPKNIKKDHHDEESELVSFTPEQGEAKDDEQVLRRMSSLNDADASAQALNVTLKRGHQGKIEIHAQKGWRGSQLIEEAEKLIFIHRSYFQVRLGAQVLRQHERLGSFLKGKPLPRNASGIECVNFQLVVDKKLSFPENLGPFSLSEVPLLREHFEPLEIDDEGWTWVMTVDAEEHFFNTSQGSVSGYAAPISPVTLDAKSRPASCIPDEASFFTWSNPLEESQRPICKDDSTLATFLSVGGFMYLDEKHYVVSVMTLGTSDKGGLFFGEKKPWEATWSPSLEGNGRFQPITVKALHDKGATEFCWINPGEELADEKGEKLPTQPDVPHGGFAYVFAERPWLNCYFPVVVPAKDVEATDKALFRPPPVVFHQPDRTGEDTEQAYQSALPDRTDARNPPNFSTTSFDSQPGVFAASFDSDHHAYTGGDEPAEIQDTLDAADLDAEGDVIERNKGKKYSRKLSIDLTAHRT